MYGTSLDSTINSRNLAINCPLGSVFCSRRHPCHCCRPHVGGNPKLKCYNIESTRCRRPPPLLATTRTTTGSTTTTKNNNRIHNNRNNCRWCVSFLVQHSTSANLEEASCLEAGFLFVVRVPVWINLLLLGVYVFHPTACPPATTTTLEHVRITSTPQVRS